MALRTAAPALRLTAGAESQIRNLAAKIPPTFAWKRSGKRLEEICGIALADLKAQKARATKAVVAGFLAGILKRLDDDYGWDSPALSEATEDGFYVWLAGEYVGLHW